MPYLCMFVKFNFCFTSQQKMNIQSIESIFVWQYNVNVRTDKQKEIRTSQSGGEDIVKQINRFIFDSTWC